MTPRFMVVAAMVVAACGGQPTSPTPVGPMTFSGTVRAFTSSDARVGAEVRYASNSGPESATATTSGSGAYTITVPAAGSYTVSVDGAVAGTSQVTGSAYRGDLLIDTTTCTSRYGQLTDARTSRPVAGATVTLRGGTSVSDANGLYRIDLGCDLDLGFSTTFIYVSRAGYQPAQQVVGRGVQGVLRLDLVLEPAQPSR